MVAYIFIRDNVCFVTDITLKTLHFSVCGITSPISPPWKVLKASIYYNRLTHTNLSTTSDHNSYTETCNAIISTIFLEEEVDKAGVDKKERGRTAKKKVKKFSPSSLGGRSLIYSGDKRHLIRRCCTAITRRDPRLGLFLFRDGDLPCYLSIPGCHWLIRFFIHICFCTFWWKFFLHLFIMGHTYKIIVKYGNAWRYLAYNFWDRSHSQAKFCFKLFAITYFYMDIMEVKQITHIYAKQSIMSIKICILKNNKYNFYKIKFLQFDFKKNLLYLIFNLIVGKFQFQIYLLILFSVEMFSQAFTYLPTLH